MADTSKIVARCRRSAQTFTRRFLFVSYFSHRKRREYQDEVRRIKIDRRREKEEKKKSMNGNVIRRARTGDRVGRAVVSLFPSLTLIQQQRNF